MRALLAIAVLSSSVMADPVPGSSTSTGPARGADSGAAGVPSASAPWQAYQPANPGSFSGTVIAPGPMQDALPHPRGMVIAPPEVGDRMGNVLTGAWPWALRPFWQWLDHGLGAIWNAVQLRSL